MTLTYFCTHNSWGFTTSFGQNMGFEPQNLLWGGFHAEQEIICKDHVMGEETENDRDESLTDS